jgi:eRF1 domain 3
MNVFLAAGVAARMAGQQLQEGALHSKLPTSKHSSVLPLVQQGCVAHAAVWRVLQMPDWAFMVRTQFGCQLEFVTNKSQEGSQFCRGFGGIGGILRYSVDTTLNEVRCRSAAANLAIMPRVVLWGIAWPCVGAMADVYAAHKLHPVIAPWRQRCILKPSQILYTGGL